MTLGYSMFDSLNSNASKVCLSVAKMDKSYLEPGFLSDVSQFNEELKSFKSITDLNFYNLKSLATEVCDQLKLIDDPEKLLKTLHNKTGVLIQDISKLEVNLFKAESEIKLYKTMQDEKTIEIEAMKESIDESISRLHKLTLENEAMRKTFKNKNSAYKEAARFYKQNLDIYVKITEINATYQITLCFFTSKFNDTYSVLLNKSELSKWGIISAQPNIGETQMLRLKQQLNETNNIVGVICTIRQIFSNLRTV